jgi:hypothetical protein
VPGRPGADPDPVEREQTPVDEDAVDSPQRKRRHRARLESRRLEDELGACHASFLAPRRRGDLLAVGALVARDHDEQVERSAREDERLDDLTQLCTDGVRRVLRRRRALCELLDDGFGTRRTEKADDAFDGLRPIAHQAMKGTNRRGVSRRYPSYSG